MSNGFLLLLAWATNVFGMVWLALSMSTHWRQVRAGEPPSLLLHALGASGLITSLALCLAADHASMAALVWVMALASAALAVAFALTWWPRALRPLVMWVRAG